ncbi:thioredoxin family protein [Leeuwenhoekiella sp. NPDC079379]|uniref:thioredoxin family protein n=1 Tax=Leeuwenhoekiella sp. NPDC079379 TaxID=3364122 RepID=UPI0037CA95F2
MKSLKILSALALVLVAAALVIIRLGDYKSGYEVGDVAADFNLKNVDGSRISLSDFKEAHGFVVVFTCNTCPFSRANEDRIIALDTKYKALGYPVIAINPNNPEVSVGDGFEAMQLKAREQGFTFPYLVDEGKLVYAQYGATKTPHVFILQKEAGALVVKYIGALDDSVRDPATVTTKFVADALDLLLAGKAIKTTSTKAIGCSIKV